MTALSAFAQWQWQPLPDFPGSPRDDAAAFSIECDVYVGTGMEVGWSLTNDWWRFDNWNGNWQPSPALPASPRQYCTALSYNGIGYLFGGLDATGPLAEMWSFDGQDWVALASLPAPGRYACAAFIGNGKLYICGGIIAGGSAVNELWAYDIDNGTWSQRTSIPGVGRHRMASVAWGSIVMGGADAAYTPLDEVWQYNEINDAWTQLPTLLEARYGGAAAQWTSGPTYIAGAVDDDTFRADAMHLTGPTWEPSEALLPSGRRGGVVASSGCGGGWNFLNYGLGLNDNMVRCNDWFVDVFAFNTDEIGAQRLSLFPNPAHDILQYHVAGDQPAAISIFDGAGVCVKRVPASAKGAVDVHDLSAGAYTLLAEAAHQRPAARFIKLP